MTGWPIELRGITEAVITTRTDTETWNVAALGLHAGSPVTAQTWGRTRTRRNLSREPRGYVQFTRDPVAFVDAALAIYEVPEPVLPCADAYVRVSASKLEDGTRDGTAWAKWALEPEEAEIERRVVPGINRGFNAVIEATIAASRLDVPGYDKDTLTSRLAFCESVVRRCGGERDHAAMRRVHALTADE